MSESKKHDEERRGLGKVVYSVDPESVQDERQEAEHESEEVTEASEESFPASDAPGYTGITSDPAEPER